MSGTDLKLDPFKYGDVLGLTKGPLSGSVPGKLTDRGLDLQETANPLFSRNQLESANDIAPYVAGAIATMGGSTAAEGGAMAGGTTGGFEALPEGGMAATGSGAATSPQWMITDAATQADPYPILEMLNKTLQLGSSMVTGGEVPAATAGNTGMLTTPGMTGPTAKAGAAPMRPADIQAIANMSGMNRQPQHAPAAAPRATPRVQVNPIQAGQGNAARAVPSLAQILYGR